MPRESPQAETRTRILTAAARLFHEHGYNATGIAAILEAAQVNSGSLYHFFPSKEALLVGVLEKYVEWLHPMVIGQVEAAEPDPIERVFELLRQYRRGLEVTGCKQGCPIGNLALEVGDAHPPVRELLDRNFANWIDAVRGWLDAAGDRLPGALDRRELAQFVLTIMEGGIMQARAAQSLAPFDAAVHQLRAYFDRLAESRLGSPPASSADSAPASGAESAPAPRTNVRSESRTTATAELRPEPDSALGSDSRRSPPAPTAEQRPHAGTIPPIRELDPTPAARRRDDFID